MANNLCPNCKKNNNTSKNESTCIDCNYKLKLKNKYYLKKIIKDDDIVTYLAIDNNNKRVLIKEFSLKDSNLWDDHNTFQKEADILSQLDYSAIPKFIESFEVEDSSSSKSYIVMQYIEGITLKDEQRQKRYTEKEIIKDIIQIAGILEYLHHLLPPVIHQDLTLSNIIRRKTGGLALVDFDSVQDVISKDRNTSISGTYEFIAPEQLDGKPVTASDYYSLGIVIILLLSKKDLDEMLDHNGKLNWKTYVNASDNIIKLIENLLIENPNKRISSLKEIKDILYGQKEKKPKKIKEQKVVKVKRKAGSSIKFIVLFSILFPLGLTYYINRQVFNELNLPKVSKVMNNLSYSKVKNKVSDRAYDRAVSYLKTKNFISAKANLITSCNGSKNEESCYQVAELFQNGRGRVKKDSASSMKYYDKACKLGSQKACNTKSAIPDLLMGKEYQKKKDYKKANIEFLKSCLKGWTESCEFIGWNYENGFGYKKNIEKAKEYYNSSCEKNSAYSCNKMGYFYETGKKLKKDLKKARAFYEKSCKLKFGLGCSNLAKFYLKGLGGKKSRREAKRLYRDACILGYKKACK